MTLLVFIGMNDVIYPMR